MVAIPSSKCQQKCKKKWKNLHLFDLATHEQLMTWLFEARKTTKRWPNLFAGKSWKQVMPKISSGYGKIDGKRLVNIHFRILQSLSFYLMDNLAWPKIETHKLLSHRLPKSRGKQLQDFCYTLRGSDYRFASGVLGDFPNASCVLRYLFLASCVLQNVGVCVLGQILRRPASHNALASDVWSQSSGT